MNTVVRSAAACMLAAAVGMGSALGATKAAPTAEHKRLEFFVGEHVIDGKLADGSSFHATETCEWFQGGFAVVCRAQGTAGSSTLAIISYSPEEKAYGYYTINSSGMVGHQRGSLQGDVWTFTSEPPKGAPKAKVVIKPRMPSGFLLTIELEGKDGKWSLYEESTYAKK